MLQWMGGSRRKVAASHTSVKKRQKQYFEQRRRQQHQFTAGSGSCSNDRNSSNQHQSLDILNFINLSTPATPECKPSRPEDVKEVVEDRDASFYSLKDNITGVGSSFNNKAETSSSKRISLSLPDNQTNDFKKANTTADLMGGTERKLSVFDLVGDDHTTTNRKECSPSEPHMAFSVEGLGKINTETPPNSPQPSSRNFSYGCSSPWNDSGQPTSNVRERLSDFEKERDIIESSKMFQDDKHYRSPIDIQATYGGRSQKLRTSTDHLHKPYISDSRGYLCDTADFNKSRVFDENEWNAKPTFLDDGVGRFYWKDQQPRQENRNFNNYGRHYTGSRSSAEHHATKKRDYLETTWRSNIEGSPVRRPQRLERAIDHPSFEKETTLDFNFDKVFDPPVWSSVVLEEDKDSHSLRSEESCSSSAVWANETSISHETNTRQRKGETDSFCNLGNKKYLNNGLSYESWEDWDVDDQQLKRKVGSGKQVRLSNPGMLRSTSQRDSSSRGGLDAPYNWFAEGFTAAGISSDITTERDKPYPFLNPVVGSSHRRQSRAPDSIPETWVPKYSAEGSGYGDDEHNYMNCVSANHKSKLAGDVCSFGSDTLSENDNEQSKEVNDPKNQGDETSSSVAKSLSDENEYM
ncbi:uncharacterized protein LOC106451424 isoform X4 [Brassica napus]|uniref:uncharacterized protein LOC106336948 isoform X5 n=1 Tax=Brassica oleracea var. oleracea TaxID=109376 RepID=UPI0006A6D4ED|nr:PREDICTED: uncharacterized protein LOC106336948 isoform X5 [Brassica oleracea var. oleracea]XP_048610265.1 uncharacterized protein LOC106451424 isoform X4 [Brassica napus]